MFFTIAPGAARSDFIWLESSQRATTKVWGLIDGRFSMLCEYLFLSISLPGYLSRILGTICTLHPLDYTRVRLA